MFIDVCAAMPALGEVVGHVLQSSHFAWLRRFVLLGAGENVSWAQADLEVTNAALG